MSRYANFLFSFIGRGICKLELDKRDKIKTNHIAVYILLGGLLLGEKVLSNIAGGIVCVVGLGYIVLEFIPSIEPPSNMREADAGWGAEQV